MRERPKPAGPASASQAPPSDLADPSSMRSIATQLSCGIVIGIACSLVLLALSLLAKLAQEGWYDALPGAFGFSGGAWWWTMTVFVTTGLLTAACVRFIPGHAGPDPATTSLVSAPLALRVLPGLALVTVLMLASGVSLGPENPIMAITIGLAAGLGPRLVRGMPGAAWPALAMAGTVGALFGTPVAAALLLTELRADHPARPGGMAVRSIWDTLVGPLTAAGAGSLTTMLLAGPDLSLHLPAYPGLRPIDLLSAVVVALVGVGIGLAAVYLLGPLHRAFALLRHQTWALIAGSVLLGALAVIGGPLTMFKGLDELGEMASALGTFGAGQLLAFAGVKLVALLIAAASAFRGGRIFPALFVGAVVGMAAHALVPAIPVSLAVAAASLGMLLPATRSGWLSLFTALAIVPDLGLLPILCIAIVPAWLATSRARPMQLPPEAAIPL